MNYLNKSLEVAGAIARAETGVGARARFGAGIGIGLQDGVGLEEGEALLGKRFRPGKRRGWDLPGAILIRDLIGWGRSRFFFFQTSWLTRWV